MSIDKKLLAACIRAVEEAETDDFIELARIAGLNPATSFRHKNLSNTNFSNSDLKGFDFSGSKLGGSKFSGAKLRGAKFDRHQIRFLKDQGLHPDNASAKTNPKRAFERYHRKAKVGDGGAMFELALCYENGSGIEPDVSKAAHWYRHAAEAGNRNAMLALGRLYKEGIGVEFNPQQAVEWYRRAAENGSRGAMFNLGFCHANGVGVETNSKKAVEWYQRAAEAGLGIGAFMLGKCYESGIGVERNPTWALEWYRKAAAAGYKHAQEILTAHPDQSGLNIHDPRLKQLMKQFNEVEWPMEPLISGDWNDLTDDKAHTALQALTRFSRLRIGEGTAIRRLRATSLSFYPGVLLCEALIEIAQEAKIICMLMGEKVILLLNGRNDTVHYADALYNLSLSSSVETTEYLRFFCTSVCTTHGHFRIVDDLSQIPFYDELETHFHEELSSKITPLRLEKETRDAFIFSGVVIHGNTLFSVIFNISRGDHAGLVEMTNDTLIAAGLPLMEERFEDIFRIRRLPNIIDTQNISSVVEFSLSNPAPADQE